MSLSWNAWSPVNWAIDLLFLAFAARVAWSVVWRTLRDAPSWAAARPMAKAAAMVLTPWAIPCVIGGGGLAFFLLARVLWTAATVGIPLAAAALFARWRAPWLAAFIVLPLGLKYYGERLHPDDLEVQHVRIELPGLKGPVRLVHLSDLQTDDIRPMHLAARKAANDFAPDFVVFTGDVINHESLISEAADYLGGFQHRQSAFFVAGDVDGILPLASFCRQIGFECLDGAAVTRVAGGTRLAFLGLGPRQAHDEAVLSGLVRASEGADARVLLSHHPDALFMARSAPIQLHLAGHTHGGQVCLPWLGPIVTLSRVSRAIAAGGLHRVGDLQVLVSRGLGWEGHIAPRVRLFCRPHLLLVELVPAGT